MPTKDSKNTDPLADAGFILLTHMEVLSMCDEPATIKFLRELVVADREPALRRLADICTKTGRGALAQTFLKAI